MILDAENVNKKIFLSINYDFLFKAVKPNFYVCRNKKYFRSTTSKKIDHKRGKSKTISNHS